MRIPIVNEQDELLGYKDQKDRNPKEITRVSGLWLTDKEGNILLARRALTKKTHPGLWGPAVAGSVEEGESYEFNIIKEAEEEIGLLGLLPTLGPKIRRHGSHEHFTQWFTFIVNHDYPFKKQDEEVEEIKWFSKDELNKLLKDKPEIFLPAFPQYYHLFITDENKS